MAAVGHHGGDFLIYRPHKHVVDDVTGDSPGNEECSEDGVAGVFVAEVFEHFGALNKICVSWLQDWERGNGSDKAYRQQHVNDVHQAEHHICNVEEPICIC